MQWIGRLKEGNASMRITIKKIAVILLAYFLYIAAFSFQEILIYDFGITIGISLKSLEKHSENQFWTVNTSKILASWFVESYIGKYYSLILGAICGLISNILLELIFIPCENCAIYFYYASHIFCATSTAFLDLVFLAFILDQLEIPQKETIFRVITALLIWIIKFATLVLKLMTYIRKYYNGLPFYVILFNAICYIIILASLIVYKNKFRIKYHFRIMEKVVYCLTKAVRKYWQSGNISVRNSLDNTENGCPEDVKDAAYKFYIIAINLWIVVTFYVTTQLQVKIWRSQIKWMSNNKEWFIYWNPIDLKALLSIIVIPFNELILLPVLKKWLKIGKTDIGRLFIAMTILGLSIIGTIFIQFKIDENAPMLPSYRYAQIRIYNGFTSDVVLKSKLTTKLLKPGGTFEIVYLQSRRDIYRKLSLRFGNEHVEYKKLLHSRSSRSVAYIICDHRCTRIRGFQDLYQHSFYHATTVSVISCLKESKNSSKFEISTLKEKLATPLPIEGEIVSIKVVNTNSSKITIAIGNETQNFEIATKGEKYTVMIPMLSPNSTEIAKLYKIVNEPRISCRWLGFPVIFGIIAESLFLVSVLRFIGITAPEEIRTCCIGLLYAHYFIGLIIAEFIVNQYNGIYKYYEIIVLFFFYVAISVMNVCLFVRFPPQYE